MRKLAIAGVVAGALLALACGDPDPQEDAAGFAAPTAASASSAAPSTVDDGSRGAGTYEVPAGIAPGKWATKGATGGIGCYWARKKDASGDAGSIIANGYVEQGAAGIIEIKATDKIVQLTGDCRWTKTG